MKVYAALRGVWHEGESLLGVKGTFDDAVSLVHAEQEDWHEPAPTEWVESRRTSEPGLRKWRAECNFYFYEVHEFEVEP